MAPSMDERAGRGLVFDIQRFSIHDGPGIRTTVFMKGCPLRCLWCANPESQDFSQTLMVRDIQCQACGACARNCPEGAITMNMEKGRVIDWDRCTQCLKCAEVCLYESLNICGRYMAVAEVLEEVIKDEIASLALCVQAEQISLLPYHEGGKSKSWQMGRTYLFEGGKAPDDEHVEALKSLIEGRGVTVSIGS